MSNFFNLYPFYRQLSLPRWLFSVTFGIITSVAAAMPVEAAKTIYFVYTPLSLSLRVSSLEAFAEDGTVNKNLAFYMNLAGVTDEEKALFREALLKPIEVDPVLLSRLLNTDEGKRILNYFGKVTNIQGGRNGKYILRGAMIKAALDPEGLSLLNFLRQLPTNVQIDIAKSLTLANQVEIIVKGTRLFIEEIAQLSEMEASSASSVDFDQLPDLRQPGTYSVEQQTWTLTDASRQRQFYVDVYKPQQWREGKAPVVVISHGLSSKPEGFATQAKHLASYGYVVALPQHPGSDAQQTQDLIEGYSRQVFRLNEFIDRPLDISYTLDELERRNATEFDERLALDNVGVFGHSFGGYTALAVAGATIDFDHLALDCADELGELNTSLLLQCRALQLERNAYNFRDERVKAVFASNPVNASIFGPQGLSQIQIPVFIGAGSYDPATPFIFEQVRSFPWLIAPDRYLQLEEGQAHVDFSQLDAGITDMIETVGSLTLPDPQLLDDYTNAMMLAFFEVYIVNDPEYRPYLQSSYSNYLSQGQEFNAHLITGASSEKLNQAIEQFIVENNID